MSKPLFGTFLADSVKLMTWPFINVDVRISSFFCNRKVFPGRMDADRTNTVSVGTVEDFSLFGLDIVDLVSVTCSVDEIILTEPVVIISFERRLTKAFVEIHSSLGK